MHSTKSVRQGRLAPLDAGWPIVGRLLADSRAGRPPFPRTLAPDIGGSGTPGSPLSGETETARGSDVVRSGTNNPLEEK